VQPQAAEAPDGRDSRLCRANKAAPPERPAIASPTSRSPRALSACLSAHGPSSWLALYAVPTDRRLAPNGWRVVEICESEEDGQNWFNNVKPNLLPDIVPNRTYHPLHTAFTK
jgi:hypothetical protein